MLTFRVVNPPRVLATALVLGAAFVAVAVQVRDPLPGETALLRGVHAERGGAAARAWQAVSDATDLLPLLVVAVVGIVVLVLSRRLRSAGLLLAAVAVPWTVNPVLKELFGRDRPELWPLGDVSPYAFPAGHAANSAALAAVVVAVLLPGSGLRAGRATLPVAVAAALLLLIGAAQLAQGRHYPSDLLAGWLWSVAWVAFVVSLPGLGPAPTRPDGERSTRPPPPVSR